MAKYNLNVNGYPNPYAWNFQQYKDYETKNNVVSTSQFRHYCDTLGGSSGPVHVRVVWPDGSAEEWPELPVDRWTTLKQAGPGGTRPAQSTGQ